MTLSAKQRQVYTAVRASVLEGTLPTVDSIALETGISRSTVSRTAVDAGYSDWREMVSALASYYSEKTPVSDVGRSAREVADIIEECGSAPILVDAVGDSEVLTGYIVIRLCENGCNATLYSPGYFDGMKGQLESGLLIVFNESGMSLLPSCLAATGRRYKVLSFTASHDSPVSKVSDINIVIKNKKSVVLHYEPNYFVAGSLALLERVFSLLGR